MPRGLPTDKEILVLHILRDSPQGMYGLAVSKASDGKLGQAAVYVTLSRMESKGFVKRRVPAAEDHPGLPRPLYRITALGERSLRAADAARLVLQGAMARCAL